jgi:flavine halogenase
MRNWHANRPIVIQGTADSNQTDKRIQEKAASGVDFALGVFNNASPEEQKAVLDKVKKAARQPEELEKLTPDELEVLQNLRDRQLAFIKGEKNLSHFASDPISGYTPNLVKGSLGLIPVEAEPANGNGHKDTHVINLLEMAEAAA